MHTLEPCETAYQGIGQSLTFDRIFKWIFGSPGCEQTMAEMLNAILGPELRTPVQTITFIPQEYVSSHPGTGRSCFLDITASDQAGRIYNIEMQQKEDIDYQMRLVVYISYLVSGYTPKGSKLSCRKVITLSFGEGPLVKAQKGQEDQVITKARFMVEGTQTSLEGEGQPMIVHINLKLARKLWKDIPVENFDVQQIWVYYIAMEGKMLTEEEKARVERVMLSAPGVLRAHERFVEALKGDDVMKRIAIANTINAEMRYAAAMENVKIQGENEGKLKGLTEGEAKAKAEFAKTMKQDGQTLETICRYTGLSEQEIAQL